MVAIMGSGGGYRAACGLSGVFSALEESCILDCATYVAGLSGSSWYVTIVFIARLMKCLKHEFKLCNYIVINEINVIYRGRDVRIENNFPEVSKQT